MARKQKVQKAVEPTDINTVSEVEVQTTTPINQEIRLAEAKPGEIESLEAQLSLAEEINLDQEARIRQQVAEIQFLNNRNNYWHEQIANASDVLRSNDAFMAAPINFLLDMMVDYEAAITEAMDLINDLRSKTQTTHAVSNGTSRKDQALHVLLPDGITSIPGPHVTITKIAEALGTNNKNISSVLTAVRDAGYTVATDELGRKYVLAYTPGTSKKNTRVTAETVPASAVITPDQFISAVGEIKRIS